jgi:hypothetical protein
MYRIGEVVVTSQGVGRILRVENEEYHVCIDFPQHNSHSYETSMISSEIRYSINNLNSSTDDDIPPRISKQKVKKQKVKYSYGSFKNVWR